MDVMVKSKFDIFAARKDDWTYVDLEREILTLYPQEGYPFVKEVILEADEIGYWPKVIERYILTNYQAYGNVSCELERIAMRVLGSAYKPSI